MNEKMYRMNFVKKDFNALMQHLNMFVDDSLFCKIKKYSTVIEDDDGTQYISVRFFGDELQRLCRFLMVALSEDISEDHFTPLVQEIKEREAAYWKKRKEDERALYDGIKKALLINPKITGTEIARKLNVTKDRVYGIWNKVRADIEQDQAKKE